MKIIAAIPARYNSTRFPGKLLAELKGKPVLQHTYENVLNTGLFAHVVVATDDERIRKVAAGFPANAVMTRDDHASGTDRIAEVCRDIDFDIVINVQGDEPFIGREPLRKLIQAFAEPQVQVASLMCRFEKDFTNPNIVKVVCDKNNFALYFSRSPIPFDRDKSGTALYWQHIGVYAFRREALFTFVKLPRSRLEETEKLEQLRLLENGIRIQMVETDYKGFGIDTPEDLERARKL